MVIPGLYFFYRSRLQVEPKARERVMSLDAAKSIEDPAEARRTVPILVLTILVFFIHKPLHLEPATVALAGAAVTLLVSRQSLHDTIASIEWLTLFFLIGLFVMVGALEETGALEEVAERDRDRHRRRPHRGAARDPVGLGDRLRARRQHPVHRGDDPRRRLARRDDDAYWWALALGACFGGNATIVAAACNVAASGMSARAGLPDRLRRLPARRHTCHRRLAAPVPPAYVMLRYA